MRFVDISVDRFGILNHTELKDLSPGLTVVYGNNGSGKTTLVNFLSGLLFGYTTDHQGFQAPDERFGGSVSLNTRNRSYRVSRECTHGVSSDLSTVDLSSGVSVSSTEAQLPAWVNETVYQEIFSVGYQEAARFDLLTRLCLDGHGTKGSPDDIRQTEQAIELAIREREGNGIEGGLRQKTSDLKRRREELVGELSEMRQASPEIPARISQLEAELAQLRQSLSTTQQNIRNVQSEILRLEQLLEELRRRNVVALQRQELEDRIAQLRQRQQRWHEIRQSVQRELSSLDSAQSQLGHSGDALKSIRALVSRLEQRMESISAEQRQTVVGVSRDLYFEHLRSEVFSLCDYVSRHQATVTASETALESLLAERTLQDTDHVQTVLQGQIDVLKDELTRADDVLGVSVHHGRNCESRSHHEFSRPTYTGTSTTRTVPGVEAEIATLRGQLDRLRGEERGVTEKIQRVEQELTLVRGQLKSAARLEDIDRLRMMIADIDAQLAQVNDRWQTLERTESELRALLDDLRSRQQSSVLDRATEYVHRLTDGDCFRLKADVGNSRILAETRYAAQPQGIQQLSRGTRDLVALALRLALIECRAEQQGRCPLILDDVFVSADDDGASAAVDLLIEVAARGQQIIFFTCQRDVREVFQSRNVHIRTLGEQGVRETPAPLPQSVEPPAPTVYVTERVIERIVEPAAPVVSTVSADDHTNWLFYLEVDSSVEDLSGLTVAELEALRASDLETIDQLLTLSVDDLETRFRERGYAISRERIRSWRGQAELATQIPMLRRSDAELLYASGIQSAVELSRMRPETVFDRVIQFQETQAGSRYRRSGHGIDRQQAINWSRWSQHSRSLTEARKSRSRFFVRSSERSSNRSDSTEATDRQDRRRSRRTRISESGSSTRRQRRPRISQESRRQREQRQSRRRERMSRRANSYRTSERAEESETIKERKFYLNRSDDVEAAPSIGPKTAQRLAKAGIYTVDDLLNARPDDVSERLQNKRINADIISLWQDQARLICQVPELRGHDAQILVACGITEAEQLSSKRPADLYAVVGPFADTSEGERIVRGGKKPDLEEVTDWISWAQHSRPLKAAA